MPGLLVDWDPKSWKITYKENDLEQEVELVRELRTEIFCGRLPGKMGVLFFFKISVQAREGLSLLTLLARHNLRI